MPWSEFNAQTLFPGPTQQVLETTGQIAEGAAQVAELAAEGMSLLEQLLELLETISDPLSAIRALINDVLKTGIYIYHDVPDMPLYRTRAFSYDAMVAAMDIDGVESQKRAEALRNGETYEPPELPLEPGKATGFTGWAARWRRSFDDEHDPQRPDFSGSAEVTAMLFIAGTPSMDALPALLAALGKLFGIAAFKKAMEKFSITKLTADAAAGDREIVVAETKGMLVDREIIVGPLSGGFQFVFVKRIDHKTKTITLYDPLERDFAKGTIVSLTATANPTAGASSAPDWRSMKVEDLPPIAALSDQIKRILALLDMAEGIIALLKELVAALKEKAQDLRNLALEIVDLVELIEDILSLTGVYVIKLESSDGPDGLFSALTEEGNPPLPAKSFVAGVCILAGTADFGPVAELFGV